MLLRIISHSSRCSMRSVLAGRPFRPETLSIFVHRGITREYSKICEQTSNDVSPKSVEPPEAEGNFERLDNLDSAQSAHQEKMVETNTEMVTYQVVNNPSNVMANGKKMEDISEGIQHTSNAHHEIFTKFLEEVEDDGYTAYSQRPLSIAAAQSITTPETKLESTSMQTVAEITADGDGQVQDFSDTLHRTKSLAALEQQAIENNSVSSTQETTNANATTSENMCMPLETRQSMALCLRLDGRVTWELDRIVAKFSQYPPIMNNGRMNVAVVKGLPAQHWRQYQLFMKFLQFWRPPFYMGRVRALMTPLGSSWEVSWQIEDASEIRAIRQTFRRVLMGDLPGYNFPVIPHGKREPL